MLSTAVSSVLVLCATSILSVHSQAYYHDEPPHHPQPYNFGYTIHDGYVNHNYQEESGDSYGAKKGSYGFTGADGIYRKVDYIADADGFRAKISTNEPGTAASSSADVQVDQYHGPPHHSSPVVAAPAYQEPVYAYRPVTVYAPPPAPYIPYYHHEPHVDHYADHHHHHHRA